jgi:hypothetical protein
MKLPQLLRVDKELYLERPQHRLDEMTLNPDWVGVICIVCKLYFIAILTLSKGIRKCLYLEKTEKNFTEDDGFWPFKNEFFFSGHLLLFHFVVCSLCII